jgi:hypothetical protein
MSESHQTAIYFSDVFDVTPESVRAHGAFDISLINDLPLFVDPFLLFHSDKAEYQALHAEVVRYMVFLRDKSIAGPISDDLLEAWFTFREVRENWLGFSRNGNKGTGLGMDFARALNGNLANDLRDFGSEKVTEGSHIEKACLIGDGVGRDNISDFATNLIKSYLLEFTQSFARKYIGEDKRTTVGVRKARFDYDLQRWQPAFFELPYLNGDYVLLTPTDLLTKDETWINKQDMIRRFPEIVLSVSDSQLRAELNNFFEQVLNDIQARDAEKRRRSEASKRRRSRRAESAPPSQRQNDEAAASTIHRYPAYVDHFIRWKEEHGDEAEDIADERVRSTERLFIGHVRMLVQLLRSTGFYKTPGNSHEEAKKRALFLKAVIENEDGWRVLYKDGQPISDEKDLHILFRLTWCGTEYDVNREANNGRGPADFAVSFGRLDKTVIEFKLASSTSLERNLKAQTEIYQKAAHAQYKLKVIVFFTQAQRNKLGAVLASLNLTNDPNIILIDARSDNKTSASKASNPDLGD